MLVRKTVTALFCDLDESVELGERLDPESLRRVHTRFFEEMAAVIDRHGGTVEKFIGDAVVAIFGIPHVHEDDALRAVRAAAEMRERVEELNDELERDVGITLRIQIGVNTGDVVVGGEPGRATLATGDAMNVAARLQADAEPGEILIGRTTYALVRDAVTAGPLESVVVKGRRAPVPRLRVEAVEARAPGVARHFDRPLVGRLAELERLQAALDAVERERTTRLVTVLGVAGVGKSRLAQELLVSGGDRARAFTGRCLPYGQGITFWPLLEMLRGAMHHAETTRAIARDLEAKLISQRVAELSSESAGGTERTFWAVRRLFETLARERPLILLFEDIHWGEPTFLDLIEYLAAWTRDAPILLLCLARPELLERAPAWTSPRPNAELVALEPLSPVDADELVDRVVADAALDAETRGRIAAAAEGNPLFVEQMVAMVGEQNGGTPLRVPPTIQALLAERLDRLPPGERDAIERASVVGRDFWRGAVIQLSPPERRDEVGRNLMSLVRKELVLPDPSAPAVVHDDTFRFAHALIRDAAYDAMSKELRAELHERFAEWLVRIGREIPELEELVGHHLERAYAYRVELGPVDDYARALARRAAAALRTTARRALARDDVRAAKTLLERTAPLLLDDPGQRGELLVELGTALMKTGEFARAEAVLGEAAEAAASAGAEGVLHRVAVERQFLRSFVDPHGAAARDAEVAQAAIAALEPLGDDTGLAKAWRLLSDTHAIACHWQERADALERALVHARRVPHARHEEGALIALLAQALHYGPTPVADAIARCYELLDDADEDPAQSAGVGATLAALLAQRGEFDEARRLYGRSVSLYDELGLRFRRAVRTLVGAEIELLAGAPEAAVDELRTGCETLEAMGERGVRAVVSAYLADVLAVVGEEGDAERYAAAAAELAEPDDIAAQALQRAARARLLARRGDAGAAVALAEDAVADAEPTDFVSLRATTLVALAEARAAEGDTPGRDRALADAHALLTAKGNLVAARAVAAMGRTRAADGSPPGL